MLHGAMKFQEYLNYDILVANSRLFGQCWIDGAKSPHLIASLQLELFDRWPSFCAYHNSLPHSVTFLQSEELSVGFTLSTPFLGSLMCWLGPWDSQQQHIYLLTNNRILL